jgi:hypothetical protein
MKNLILQHFLCPESVLKFALSGNLSDENIFFRFNDDIVCYGRLCKGEVQGTLNGNAVDVSNKVRLEKGTTYLPFDAAEIVDNFRLERYTHSIDPRSMFGTLAYRAYYFVRPSMPVAVRRHLQKAWLKFRPQGQFPKWPVDHSVESLLNHLLLLAIQAQQIDHIPFIWFWPEGASSCAIMTHDVETTLGRNFCGALMDIDDEYGIKACFSIVPESRYEVTQDFLDSITRRGFEVIVQDLNHDGRLFKEREEYLRRVQRINEYGAKFGAKGFRSAVLYRNQAWFDSLKFSYDTSVPSVGHLEPQHGGCCTLFPYFIGDLLELPVTTTQDYALFNYLNKYTLTVWERQIEVILQQNGLMNFIVHPDYITTSREQKLYTDLLSHLSHLSRNRGLWLALPREVDHWWRQRAKMRLRETPNGLIIEGEGSDRARIAYAYKENGRLAFTLANEVPIKNRRLQPH